MTTGISPFDFQRKEIFLKELCMACLHEPLGLCGLHAPKPLTFEESLAIACEITVQQGLAKRLDDTTIQLIL